MIGAISNSFRGFFLRFPVIGFLIMGVSGAILLLVSVKEAWLPLVANQQKRVVISSGTSAKGIVISFGEDRSHVQSIRFSGRRSNREEFWQKYPYTTVRFAERKSCNVQADQLKDLSRLSISRLLESNCNETFQEVFFPTLIAGRMRLGSGVTLPIKILVKDGKKQAVIHMEALGYQRDPSATFFHQLMIMVSGLLLLGVGLYCLWYLAKQRLHYDSQMANWASTNGKWGSALRTQYGGIPESQDFTVTYSFLDESGRNHHAIEFNFPANLALSYMVIPEDQQPELPIKFDLLNPQNAKIDRAELQQRIQQVRLERRQKKLLEQ